MVVWRIDYSRWLIDAIRCNLRLDAIEIENWRSVRNCWASRNCVLWRLGLWPTLGFDKDWALCSLIRKSKSLETKPHCFSMFPRIRWLEPLWILPGIDRGLDERSSQRQFSSCPQWRRSPGQWRCDSGQGFVWHSLTRPKLQSQPTNIIGYEWIWHTRYWQYDSDIR